MFLKIKNLNASIDSTKILNDFSLNVEEGDYWSNTTVSLEPEYAWTFQVSDGKNRYLKKTQTGRLRLVRYAK